MRARHLHQFTWFIAIAAGLGGSLIACSKEEPPATPASLAKAQTFRFAPPDGTQFVRTDRKHEEIAIVGTPLRRVDDEELRWKIRVNHTGDAYNVTQDLVYISLGRNGQTLAAGDVPPGISAKLVIDNQGNLMRVEGLERTAEILRSLVSAGKETEAASAISPDALARIVAARYRLLFGDTIGRDAAPGSTWTIKNPPGTFVASRTVTVTGHEPCDDATCAKLQVDFQLDPQMLADTARDLAKPSPGTKGEAAKVTAKNANYTMHGWMLVEPATMLSHGASLTEGGSVTVAQPGQKDFTIEIKGTTDLSYQYGEAAVSAL